MGDSSSTKNQKPKSSNTKKQMRASSSTKNAYVDIAIATQTSIMMLIWNYFLFYFHNRIDLSNLSNEMHTNLYRFVIQVGQLN